MYHWIHDHIQPIFMLTFNLHNDELKPDVDVKPPSDLVNLTRML